MHLTMQLFFLTILSSHISLTWGADFINHLGIPFKTIKPGIFYMGSCSRPTLKTVCPSNGTIDPAFSQNEVPQHRVTIAHPFQIGLYEITLEQFQAFITECPTCQPNLLSEDFRKANAPNYPVVQVSWDEIQAFITWLNATKPITDLGTYRLPTEAEWEYAARAGTQTIYWWGDQLNENNANCADCNPQWDNQQTLPVGSFRPNPWGLYDMIGNVGEWVEDCWNRNYMSAPIDGSAWKTGECLVRMVRGGSWLDASPQVRVAVRDWKVKDCQDLTIGFRLVRQLDPKKLP